MSADTIALLVETMALSADTIELSVDAICFISKVNLKIAEFPLKVYVFG
ncbi:MAG: hypothetical protein KME55_07195 [Nostoc indistinguendum CM1-VF10]|nr:hypothetical protein [Nostoc indistinguendum CM1-VF10]